MPVQTKSTTARRLLESAALAVLIAGAGLGSAEAATRIGWVRNDNPVSDAAYTPAAAFAYNSAGGTMSISRPGTGVYNVVFNGLGTTLTDNILVNAFDTSGYCVIQNWTGGAGSAVSATVLCFDASGNAANTEFNLLYQAHSGNIGNANKGTAFLWANQQSAPSYTPDGLYQYNSTGVANTVVRNGTGDYTATLPGLDKVGGNAEVSAYGDGPARCKVASLGQDTGGTEVRVLCFDSTGAASDQRFTLEYSRHLTTAFQTTTTTSGLYAWGSKPAVTDYDTSGPYSFNAFGTGRLHAHRSGTGQYVISAPADEDSSTGDAIATAYGTSNRYCNVFSWYPVVVVCYAQGGGLADTQFVVSYQIKPAP